MNTRLDNLLKQWQAARAPSEQSRQALRNRILRDVECQATPSTQTERTSRFSGWEWMPRAALGLAVVALLAIAVWTRMPPSLQKPIPSVAQVTAESWITPPYALVAFYKGSKDLFGGALEWVAQSDQKVEVGLENQPSEMNAQPSQDPAYAVTIAIVTRQQGTTRVVWKSDIIARNETWVNIPPVLTHNIQLSTWFCRVGKGKLAVDSQWTVCKTKTVTGGISQIIKEGNPVEVGSFTCDGVDYKILQIARPLEQLNKGGSC